MKPIIESIDGEAFAVIEDTTGDPCHNCALFYDRKRCALAKWCEDDEKNIYRRLTDKERKELHKTIGNGLEGSAKTSGEIDLTEVSAVCHECATRIGCKPKDKVVGVWVDTCGICKEQKPCTDLWHDWVIPKKGGMK